MCGEGEEGKKELLLCVVKREEREGRDVCAVGTGKLASTITMYIYLLHYTPPPPLFAS